MGTKLESELSIARNPSKASLRLIRKSHSIIISNIDCPYFDGIAILSYQVLVLKGVQLIEYSQHCTPFEVQLSIPI